MKCPKSEEFSRKRYQNMHEPRRRRVAAPYADAPERSGGANPYEIAAAIGHAALYSRSCTDLRRHHVPAKQQVQHERGQQHFQSLMLRARSHTAERHCILYGKVKTPPK